MRHLPVRRGALVACIGAIDWFGLAVPADALATST